MLRLGGTASTSHMVVFQGLQKYLLDRGVESDWVLYSGYDALVEAFVSREIDVAWNGPLSYVKIQRLLDVPSRVLVMRDEDVDFATHFISQAGSDISSIKKLKGKSFAFGSRGSIQTGLLAYHFLKEAGINPTQDLSDYSFFDDRTGDTRRDEVDVFERVMDGEYDAGAISASTLLRLELDGVDVHERIQKFWDSPAYSHCCFTGQSDMDEEVSQMFTDALVKMEYSDPLGKEILDGEGCKAFVPGITTGWEILEAAAEQEGLI